MQRTSLFELNMTVIFNVRKQAKLRAWRVGITHWKPAGPTWLGRRHCCWISHLVCAHDQAWDKQQLTLNAGECCGVLVKVHYGIVHPGRGEPLSSSRAKRPEARGSME